MTSFAALQRGARGCGTLGQWCSVAIGASIPVSIAMDNLLLALALLAWLAGLYYREKLQLAWTNPVYRAALLLFAVLLASTLYGYAAPGDRGTYLLKYLDLALIPVLGWAFLSARRREQGLYMLAAGLALVLLISCAMKIGLVPTNPWLRGTAESPIVFKLRLTQNILMAFAAFFFAWLYCSASAREAKAVWAALGILAVTNIMLMVQGVTGYILLIALMLLFGWQRARLRGIGIAAISTCVLLAVLTVLPGPFQSRGNEVLFELKTESADRPASTSTGFRLEFYRNTLTLISKHPVTGTGTGSFPAAYAALVEGSGQNRSRNPHNEFMLIMVQTGIVGLSVLLWLFWLQWRLAAQLPTPLERGLAQGMVTMMIIVCMLNSALLDHTEGLLYAWLTALLYAGLPQTHAPGSLQ